MARTPQLHTWPQTWGEKGDTWVWPCRAAHGYGCWGMKQLPALPPMGLGLCMSFCFCPLPRTLSQHGLRADPPSPPSPQYSQSQMLATVIKTQPDSFSPECTPTHVPTK